MNSVLQEARKDPTPEREAILAAIHSTSLTPKERFQEAEKLVSSIKERFPELKAILERKANVDDSGANVSTMQSLGIIPARSEVPFDLLRKERCVLPEANCKDGSFYCMRGDFPGLEKTGIVSYVMKQWMLPLSDLLEVLRDEEVSSHLHFHANNKLEEFMWMHSNGGFEAFLSVTTSEEIARRHPKYERDSGTVYIIKVPINAAFRNYATVVDGNEQEYLVPDLVTPKEIVAAVDPKKMGARLDIRDFM